MPGSNSRPNVSEGYEVPTELPGSTGHQCIRLTSSAIVYSVQQYYIRLSISRGIQAVQQYYSTYVVACTQYTVSSFYYEHLLHTRRVVQSVQQYLLLPTSLLVPSTEKFDVTHSSLCSPASRVASSCLVCNAAASVAATFRCCCCRACRVRFL